MKILIQSNIDAYKTNCFPTNLAHVPRKGEYVAVTKAFEDHYIKKGLPTRLVTTSVIHAEYGVVVKVHYSETQIELMQTAGTNMYP